MKFLDCTYLKSGDCSNTSHQLLFHRRCFVAPLRLLSPLTPFRACCCFPPSLVLLCAASVLHALPAPPTSTPSSASSRPLLLRPASVQSPRPHPLPLPSLSRSTLLLFPQWPPLPPALSSALLGYFRSTLASAPVVGLQPLD